MAKTRTKRLGHRAIVCGASLAGSLTARVLADYFDEVIALDRDTLPSAPDHRRMTPQSRHVHVLLKGGELAIERLLPGFSTAMENAGAVSIKAGREFLTGGERGFAPQWDAPWNLLGQSRPALEHLVRARVRDYATNIEFREDVTIRGLTHADGRITGVDIETGAGHESLPADLVIDASGRAGNGVRWLKAAGLPVPNVEEVKIDFGYTSGVFRLPEDAEREWSCVLIGTTPPAARGALLMPIADGLHICSVGGRFGDFPPNERAGFLAFLESLPQPQIFDVIRDAEQLTDLETIRYEYNRFRHYEQMSDRPAGFLPIGDALCAVNPTYGQGMTSAAQQAVALLDVIEASDTASIEAIGSAFLTHAVTIATVPWRQANFRDLSYPETIGDRTMFSTEESTKRIALELLQFVDPEIRLKLFKVSQLVEPPSILDTPEIDARVAAAVAQYQAQQAAGSAPSPDS